MKGFSLIECPESGHEHDIYVPKSAVNPALLDIGDEILFAFHINDRGKPQVSVPVWKLEGRLPEQTASLPDYEGVVRNVHNGDGFVKCSEINEQFDGADAYAHKRVMASCGLLVGDTLRFMIHVNSAGRPQVSAPCWKCLTEDGHSKNGTPGDWI